MPIHSHDATQRLKPKRVAHSRDEFGSSVRQNNVLNNGSSERGHAFGQPHRHAASMQRQVRDARPLHILNYPSERFKLRILDQDFSGVLRLERDRLVAVLPLITWRNRLVGAPALHVVLYSGSGT